jgi:dTDP-4-dehydrorhamnose 3,5-epimerase-like enzyme
LSEKSLGAVLTFEGTYINMMTNMSDSPQIFKGDISVDDRGALRFVNEFDFSKVQRFYQVENFSKDVIRAFHGHLKEGKYVYVPTGSILLCWVPLTDKKHPSRDVEVQRLVLSDRKPQVVFIPPGNANGFRVLEENSQVLFFSTSTLEESKGDDYRFAYDYWGEEIWKVENR